MKPDGNGTPYNESQINNRFLFTGREWVSRFGFYEYRARAYHPGLGRFMSEDPLGFAAGDANLFRYCENDPVNRNDPSGEGFQYTRNGNNIHLYIPVAYSPSSGLSGGVIGSLNRGIEHAWTGQFGIFNVRATVTGPISGITNYVQLRLRTLSSNSVLIYVPGDVNNPAAVASHEAGHWMNLHNVTDPSDIMGNVFARPSEKDIRDILARGGSALIPGPLHEPAANVLVGLAVNNAIGALFNAAQTFGSGFGYVTITRPDGTSQVVFSRRFDTSGYYGPSGPGSLSGPALDAWQMTIGGVPGGGGQPGEGSHPVPFGLN